MIETTHVPLLRAAEMLGTDADTLLSAASEGRLKLWGFLNKPRNVVKRRSEIGSDGQRNWITLEVASKHMLYVPLSIWAVANLYTYDIAFPLTVLSDPDEEGCFWEDADLLQDPNFPSTGIMRDKVFMKAGDIDEIIRENDRRDSVEVCKQPVPSDRSYISNKLARVTQAARLFWVNADQNDPMTHPNNAKVAAWLTEHGLSKSQAERAASIIRPEWAHNGRMPDKL